MKRPIDITCKMCGGHGTAYLTKGPSGKASWPVVGVLPPNWVQMAEPEAATYVTTVYLLRFLSTRNVRYSFAQRSRR